MDESSQTKWLKCVKNQQKAEAWRCTAFENDVLSCAFSLLHTNTVANALAKIAFKLIVYYLIDKFLHSIKWVALTVEKSYKRSLLI